MSGDVVRRHDLRMADADRERVVERLQVAVGEGRLTLEEFEQRVDGVLAARTFGEIEPYVEDLPAVPTPVAPPPREYAELRATASDLKRRGQWVVPRQLVVFNKAGSVKLDFTDAVIAHRVVDIELDALAGSTTLVVPRGSTVTIEDVDMIASSASVRRVPMAPVGGDGVHFVVHGRQKASSLVVRHQRRFWRWRW